METINSAAGQKKSLNKTSSKKDKIDRDSKPRKVNNSDPDLPPNEHAQKHPDEVYGDTEITDRFPEP